MPCQYQTLNDRTGFWLSLLNNHLGMINGHFTLLCLNVISYMSAHVLLNLLNELGKKINCEACRAFHLFFATHLINSIIQEHKC